MSRDSRVWIGDWFGSQSGALARFGAIDGRPGVRS